ncbi:MAG: GatB/YqeY domain-containing protein [bacterium]
MLRDDLQDQMKAAMKGGDKARLGVIRLILAAVKQREVDERIELDDQQVLLVLDKMVKQRRDSVTQYEAAGRNELADQEKFEIGIIQEFLPEALSESEIEDLIQSAINDTGAESMKDMGKVMGMLKPQLQGRADMGAVSALIKSKLS